jgi:hypothetical protein
VAACAWMTPRALCVFRCHQAGQSFGESAGRVWPVFQKSLDKLSALSSFSACILAAHFGWPLYVAVDLLVVAARGTKGCAGEKERLMSFAQPFGALRHVWS